MTNKEAAVLTTSRINLGVVDPHTEAIVLNYHTSQETPLLTDGEYHQPPRLTRRAAMVEVYTDLLAAAMQGAI